MKTKSIGLLILCSIPLFAQYQAVVRMEYWSWQENGNEMQGYLYADLYYNGQPQLPDTVNYAYIWEQDEGYPGVYTFYHYGYTKRHGVNVGQGYNVRVTITGPGSPPAFSVTSAPAYFDTPPESQRHGVWLFSKLEDGTPTTGLNIYFWAAPGWHVGKGAIVGTDPVRRYFTNNDPVPLQSSPGFRAATNDKFNRWEDNNNAMYYLNHQEFRMSTNLTQLTSRYRNVADGVTLKTDLMDAPGANTNLVQLKEPWLKDLTDSYDVRNQGLFAPFKGVPYGTNNLGINTAYKGVFLDQNPNFIPDQPSYWVRAPLTQSINGLTHFRESLIVSGASLQNYSADSTRVNFTSSGASITARYKAYQASSYADATGYNNQRKLVAHTLGGTTVHHLVYESGGDIWYATSTNGGAWTPEVLVSDGSGNNHNPSIDVYNAGSSNIYAHVVWVNTANATVYFRERHSYVGTWTWKPIEAVPVTEPTPGYNPISWTPVVSRNYVAYNRYHNGGSGGAIVVKNRWSQNNWFNAGPVPNTTASCKNPSIAYDDLGYCNVAYENSAGGTIHYNRTIHQGSGYYSWGLDEQVSPVGWLYNSYPSLTLIATGGGTPAVAWQSWNNVVSCGSSVHVRPKFNGWAAVQSYSYSYQTDIRPTLGGLKDTYSMSVMWSNNGTITRGTYANYSWSAPTVIASGSNGGTLPNMTVTADVAYQSKVVWRKSDWPLAFSGTGISGGGIEPIRNPGDDHIMAIEGTQSDEQELAYRWTRQALLDLAAATNELESSTAQGTVGFDLQELRYGERLIKYSMPVDTELVSEKPFLLTSEPFVIGGSRKKLLLSGELQGKYLYLPKSQLSSDATPLVTVTLMDAKTKEPIKTISSIPVSWLAQIEENSFSTPWKGEFDPVGLEGKEVYVQVSMLGESVGTHPVIVDNYFVTDGSEHQAGQQESRDKSEVETPSRFALHQNFPNPFNPETRISFELKESGHVRLAIYDMLGREVVVLADHHHSPGLHSRTWNAEGFGSGVFVYRLTALDESGKLLFRQSKRMLLVK